MKHKLLSILLCLAMALSLLPTAALADETTGAGTIKVGETSYSSFSDAVNVTTPDENGVITYEISGKVDVTDTGWVQVAKAGLPDLSKVAFVGITDDAEICITGGLAILADQKYDIDVSFTNLKLSKPNPTYGGDYGHSTNYFTCWLRNTGAAENTVTYTNCTFPNGVCNNQYGKTVFNNCQFTNSANYNLWNYGGNTEVKGSTFIGTRGIKTYNEGDLDVAPTVTVTDTSFDGLTEKAAIVASKATDITLTNVTATGCTKGLLQKDIEGSTDEQKVTIEANGTGISGDFNITAEMDAEAAKNEFNITAGTFAGEINNDYLAPGANFDATTGEVKMSYVAKIGDTEYPTLADAFAAANKTGDTVIELLDDINMTGKNWTPVEVDGNHGQGVITLNGNDKTITGLSAPLFAGGFAGNSGIVIKDLTIDRAIINDTTNAQGIGAFINCVDSMPRIELVNCHLTNSTISSTGGARVGGLIGWTAGYNKQNDGPVDTYISIRNCSVELCSITAKGSVGGLIGHAGGNPATYHDIADCKLVNNYLYSTDDGGWRVGALVGTANVGQVTVDAATSATGNTLSQTGKTSAALADGLFGRAVVNNDGLVIVDNKVVATAEKYGVKVGDKVTSDNLVKNENGVWEKAPDPYIDLDTFIKWVKENDYSVDGSSYTANKRAVQGGKLTVKWSPVSSCFDLSGGYHQLGENCPNVAATGNTPNRLQDPYAQYQLFASATGLSISNVNFVYVPAKVSVCMNGSWGGKDVTPTLAELQLKNSGDTTFTGCTFDKVTVSPFGKGNDNGNTNEQNTVSFTGCEFANVTDKYAIKDVYAGNVTVENCTFTNCGGGIYLEGNAKKGTIDISGNTFTNIGTKGLIQFSANGDYTSANITLDGNTAKNCGPTLRQLNQGIADNDVLSKNLKGDLTGLGGKLTFTSDSVKKTDGNEPVQPTIYTVKFSGSDVADMKVASGTTIDLPKATKSGYTFKGWKLGTETKQAGDKVTISSDTTFTAVWQSNSSGSSGSSDPTYSVSTPSKTEHGSVTVSPKNASKGDTVTVTVKPDSGYVLETLTVTDKNGNELTLKDKGNGKYTFTMPAGKVEVKATFMEDNSMLNFFYDVPNNAYFYEAVKWAVENGITTGVGNDLFAPEQPCTRAQIVTFLWRAAGSPEPKGAASGMTDVVSGSYYEKAVAWAIENGITTGTTTSTFSPDATCTRAQAVTFLARALKAKAASAAEFSDVPTDSYFADAVAWAAANGVTEGIGGGLFGSDNDCTRGQIVTFLYRAYNK